MSFKVRKQMSYRASLSAHHMAVSPAEDLRNSSRHDSVTPGKELWHDGTHCSRSAGSKSMHVELLGLCCCSGVCICAILHVPSLLSRCAGLSIGACRKGPVKHSDSSCYFIIMMETGVT